MTTTAIKTTRQGPGSYEVSDGREWPYVVTITRSDDLDARYGQWVARAEWDRYTVTDPLYTLADAKVEAAFMLAEAAR